MNTNIKKYALPVATGAVIVSIVAGILIFFHGFHGMPQSSHVWLSSVFVVAVVFYTLINLKRLT
jgi:high-affinity Fe2+/Pb2+ permease